MLIFDLRVLAFVVALALLSANVAYSQVDDRGIILPEVQQKLLQLNQEWYANHTGQANLTRGNTSGEVSELESR